jgi:hypothetical protein
MYAQVALAMSTAEFWTGFAAHLSARIVTVIWGLMQMLGG